MGGPAIYDAHDLRGSQSSNTGFYFGNHATGSYARGEHIAGLSQVKLVNYLFGTIAKAVNVGQEYQFFRS
jgi:hypothetical protein